MTTESDTRVEAMGTRNTEAAASSQMPVRTFGNVSGGNETVLLVDDEPVIIDLGIEVLEHAG